MKVALLFFGQPRYLDDDRAYNDYKRLILDRYDTDVYIHTWFDEAGGKYDVSTWAQMHGAKNAVILPDSIERLKKMYNPKVLVHEKPQKFVLPPECKAFVDEKFTDKHPEGHWNPGNYSNIMSQLKTIQRVAQLYEETGDKHDIIVLARLDTWLENFPDDLSALDPSKFYLPGHHNRFPDVIHVCGRRYLGWMKNAFNDINNPRVFHNIWEPSPEAFKGMAFLLRYRQSDLSPNPMNAHTIRK
ncbi:hypothetical protein [Synechococcus phage S-8S53]|nr:hypothetical protein [Synechococcus phage S-8S53]